MHATLLLVTLSAAPRLFHDFGHPKNIDPPSLGISAADNALWHALVMNAPADLPRSPIAGWPAALAPAWAKTWSLYDELLAGTGDVARRELAPVVGEALWQAYLDGMSYEAVEQLVVFEKGREGKVSVAFSRWKPDEEFSLRSFTVVPEPQWPSAAAKLIGLHLTRDAGIEEVRDRVVTHGPLPGQAVIFLGDAAKLQPLKVPAGCVLPAELALDVSGVWSDALSARWKASVAGAGGRQWCAVKTLNQATGTHAGSISETIGWALVRMQCGEDISVAGVRLVPGSLDEVTRKLIEQQLAGRCTRGAPKPQPSVSDAVETCKRTGRALPATLTFPEESALSRNLLAEWSAAVKNGQGELECRALPEEPLPSPDPKDKSVSARRVGLACGGREVWAKVVRKQGKSDVKPLVASLAALWCGLPVWE